MLSENPCKDRKQPNKITMTKISHREIKAQGKVAEPQH